MGVLATLCAMRSVHADLLDVRCQNVAYHAEAVSQKDADNATNLLRIANLHPLYAVVFEQMSCSRLNAGIITLPPPTFVEGSCSRNGGTNCIALSQRHVQRPCRVSRTGHRLGGTSVVEEKRLRAIPLAQQRGGLCCHRCTCICSQGGGHRRRPRVRDNEERTVRRARATLARAVQGLADLVISRPPRDRSELVADFENQNEWRNRACQLVENSPAGHFAKMCAACVNEWHRPRARRARPRRRRRACLRFAATKLHVGPRCVRH